jgi:centromeric protein E
MLQSILESPCPSVNKYLSYSDASLLDLGSKEPIHYDRIMKTMPRQSTRQSSTAPFTLMHEIHKLEHLQDHLWEEANRALKVLQKEVACHRLDNQDAADSTAKLQAKIREISTI